MENPDSIESAWAGLLNGTMITLLGAAFPALVLWRVAIDWRDLMSWRPDMISIEEVQFVVLTCVSARVVWFGMRMIARQATWLRQKRG